MKTIPNNFAENYGAPRLRADRSPGAFTLRVIGQDLRRTYASVGESPLTPEIRAAVARLDHGSVRTDDVTS